MLNRREVLAAFLGAAVACRAKPEPPLPPGVLVGASHESGHRLRETINLTPQSWETRDVVIVGSGIAGLAAAWRLAGKADALVLELEPAIGGTARSGASSVSAYPWGAHYVPAPGPENRLLLRLLREMQIMEGDVVAEQFLCRDPEERVFYRGRWYEGLYLTIGASDEDLRQLRRFEAEIRKWVEWRDAKGRRAFAIPTAHGSDDAEVTALDKLSMATWMSQRGFTSPRLRWFVEYACRDDYGALLEETSAWAALFYFAARVSKAGDESEPLVTWPEGNGRVVAHLGGAAKVRTGALVTNILPSDTGAEVTYLRDGAAAGVRAKRVIFATPQFIAPRVIAPWREESPPHVGAFTYGSWMVANLTLRDRPESRGFPLAWDNVLYDSPSLGYVVATHQRGVEHGPTVFTYFYPLCDSNPRVGRERLLSAGRDQWADVALTDLSRAHPEIRSLTTRVDVMRWGHAMIRPVPGFVWSDARRRAAQPYRTIHFANTDLSAVPLLEEALDHGVRAAEEVLVAMARDEGSWR